MINCLFFDKNNKRYLPRQFLLAKLSFVKAIPQRKYHKKDLNFQWSFKLPQLFPLSKKRVIESMHAA
jgi:hypothetical protein